MSERQPFADRQASLFVLAIVLLAFALRLHLLAYDAIWWDEGYSVWISHFSLPRIVAETARDVHPPLYYALLHLWMNLAGRGEFVIRLPSVFFGVLTVVFIYQAGRTVGGRTAGAGAALLATVGPVMVRWSQETRMHSQAACLASLALWAALHLLLIDRHRWRWAAIFGGATAAVLLSLYLAAGAVLAIDLGLALVFLLHRKQRWRWALPWVVSQAGAFLLFLPWILYASHRLPIDPEPVQLSFLPFVNVYAHVILLGLAENLERYRALFFGALLLSGLALVAAGRDARQTSWTAWPVLLVSALLPPLWLFTVFALPRAQNFDNLTPSARYVVSLAAPLYVLLGWGIASLYRFSRSIGMLCLAGLVALSGWPLIAYYQSITPVDDYATLAATLEALRQPDDVVLLNNDREWPTFWYHVPDFRAVTYTQIIDDNEYAAELLDTLAEDSPGVWLVQTPFAAESDPQARLALLLEQQSEVYRFDLPEASLIFYARTDSRVHTARTVQQWPDGFRSADLLFGEETTLTGYTLPGPAVRQGQRVGVGLGWQSDADAGQWPVELRLLSRGGEEISSALVTLSSDRAGRYFQPVSLAVPADAPTGPARLVFVAGPVWQPLGSIRILPANRPPQRIDPVPSDALPVHVQFGGSMELAAVSLPSSSTFTPGEPVPLTLYWRAGALVPDSYKVFVHVVGQEVNPATGNSIWGQQDQIPGGQMPTSGWLPGTQLADSYAVSLDPDILSGEYDVQVGLYEPRTGQRLLAVSSDGTPLGDSVSLLTITVP